MYNGIVFAGPLGSINVAASASLAALQPLLSQIDFALLGSFGLGAIKTNLQVQLSANQQAALSLSLGLTNPVFSLQRTLLNLQQLQASILAALSIGFTPAVSVELTAKLSASAAMAVQMKAQIAALDAIIDAGVTAKAPAVKLANKLQGALSAGPVFAVSWDGSTLSSVGAAIAGDFSSGLTEGLATIGPTEAVYGVLLVTKSPTAWAAMMATMLT